MRYTFAMVRLLLLSLALLQPAPTTPTASTASTASTTRPDLAGEPMPQPSGWELPERAERLEAEILKEAETTDVPWAGRYYRGDGTGYNVELHLAPEAGLLASLRGCLGMYGLSHGEAIELEDGSIEFRTVEERTSAPSRAWPVQRGEVKYLVIVGKEKTFANQFNAGEDLGRGILSGSFSNEIYGVSRMGGRLEAPAPLRDLLLDEPIRGTLTAVGEQINVQGDYSGARHFAVEVDLGSDDQGFPGMILHVRDPEWAGEIVITSVELNLSAGQLTQRYWKTRDDEKPAPAVGWSVSSESRSGARLAKHRAEANEEAAD